MRGAQRRNADLNIVRVQDVAGLSGADDATVLEWIRESMPGLIAVPRDVPVGVAIEDLLLIAEYSSKEDWQGQVSYLPLQELVW